MSKKFSFANLGDFDEDDDYTTLHQTPKKSDAERAADRMRKAAEKNDLMALAFNRGKNKANSAMQKKIVNEVNSSNNTPKTIEEMEEMLRDNEEWVDVKPSKKGSLPNQAASSTSSFTPSKANSQSSSTLNLGKVSPSSTIKPIEISGSSGKDASVSPGKVTYAERAAKSLTPTPNAASSAPSNPIKIECSTPPIPKDSPWAKQRKTQEALSSQENISTEATNVEESVADSSSAGSNALNTTATPTPSSSLNSERKEESVPCDSVNRTLNSTPPEDSNLHQRLVYEFEQLLVLCENQAKEIISLKEKNELLTRIVNLALSNMNPNNINNVEQMQAFGMMHQMNSMNGMNAFGGYAIHNNNLNVPVGFSGIESNLAAIPGPNFNADVSNNLLNEFPSMRSSDSAHSESNFPGFVGGDLLTPSSQASS